MKLKIFFAFFLSLPLIIILLNVNSFKNKFLNVNFSSIGSLNGLNEVVDTIKGNTNKNLILILMIILLILVGLFFN